MNPIKRLYDNRNNLRKKNLSENIEIWKFIINNINDDDVVAKAMNSETLSFKLKNQKMINRNIKFIKIILMLNPNEVISSFHSLFDNPEFSYEIFSPLTIC